MCVTVNGKRFRLGLGYDFAKDAIASLERIASKLESLKMANEKLLDRKLVKEVRHYSFRGKTRTTVFFVC